MAASNWETINKEVNKVIVRTDRVEKRRKECIESKENVSTVRSRLVTEAWRETEGQPVMMRRTRLFQKVMEGNPISIWDGELVVGSQTEFIRGSSPYVDFTVNGAIQLLALDIPKARGEVVEAVFTNVNRHQLEKDVEYWKDKAPADVARKWIQEIIPVKVEDLDTGRLMNFGDTLPPPSRNVDYEKVIKIGLNGVIDQIKQEQAKLRDKTKDLSDIKIGERPPIWENWERYVFLKAAKIACEGVITLAKRYADEARKMAKEEKNAARRRELEKIAETCEWVPANPARNFRDALQSFWFVHLASNLETASDGETPGRIDQTFYPYYEKDIKEGKITRQEAAELLGCLWVKFNEMLCVKAETNRLMHQASHFQDTTICGVTKDGRDATNELTFLVLEVTRQMRLPQPPLYLRYHKGISEDVMIKAAETNRDYGGGSPAYLNDEVTIPMLLGRGVPLVEARDWIASGCIGAQIPHANPIPVGIFAHMAKAFDLALHNGVDLKTGKRLGPATGDARNFKSYEELYDALLKQVEYQTELAQDGYRMMFTSMTELYALPFTYALMDDCITKYGRYNLAGARYPQIGIDRVERGFQNVGDSLTAIKKLVFEEKKITMAELVDALETNFEGKEDLRRMLIAAPKYGNDDDYPDDIFGDMVLDVTRIESKPLDMAGYPMMVSRNGASGNFYVGMAVGATPDGRRAWEPIADAALSPVQGMDVKGPTAVILSATKINHYEYATSALLNMKIAPEMIRKRDGIKKFNALIKTFFNRGGWHIQFNTVGQQTLLDAKEHPEQHKDLLVRVAGYSAYFIELSPDVQNEIIKRTEHGL